MPFIVPILAGTVVFMAGAFTGAQVDDSFEDNHPASVSDTHDISLTRLALYGAAGLALLYGAQKTGLVKMPK